MIVTNAMIPTGEQLSALAADERDLPVVMLNLLRFRAKAVYADGRTTDLSGEAAYMLYADQMVPYVESRGARVLFQGDVRLLPVGAVEDMWNIAALVQYPSPRAFLEIAMAPEVHGFAVHREAGLEGQLLVMLTERG